MRVSLSNGVEWEIEKKKKYGVTVKCAHGQCFFPGFVTIDGFIEYETEILSVIGITLQQPTESGNVIPLRKAA